MIDLVMRRIEEQVVEGKRLGRHVKHDPRSRNFPAEQASVITDVLHTTRAPMPLDQGNLGSCTANALVGARNIDPNYGGRGAFQEKDAVWLYWNEVVEEGYQRGDDVGGTGIDVCKVAMAAKWITSYQHTFDLNSALLALVLRPGMIGCNWYEGFDSPDGSGVVKLAGQVRGGHEIVADQIDTGRKLVGCWNSWGPDYGLGGRFFFPYAVLEQLLSEQGDFTVPVR